jgi:hypothetical protein
VGEFEFPIDAHPEEDSDPIEHPRSRELLAHKEGKAFVTKHRWIAFIK